ncbi:hypothetical protein FANTH_2025 [Fusarium anthophilum]|uniref:Uncharacterized protein n=1 Tax=Fusarium anthophilum TaxID=48485 RepID=A0A8H4ZVM6_9HYPO|nr:hypothetical protein FANTH_2025 [Fusarium anthophilum]
MSSAITTSLLMLEYAGIPNLVAEVIGANPTATTFVLDCENPNHKKIWEDGECYITKDTVILGPWGPWADKTPASGDVTTGIWREVCTTTNHASFAFDDGRGVTATYTEQGDVDGFFYGGYEYFGWAPVTITAGQSYLLSAKTASFTEASSTGVSGTGKAEEATISATETGSTTDKAVITVTGEASSTTSSNAAGTRRGLSLWAAVGIMAALVLA